MMNNDNSLIGIVPSGGLCKRMKPFRMWKELINVGYKTCETDVGTKYIPKVLAEYTLEGMVDAGSQKIMIVLNEQKNELLRYFGNGSYYGTSIAYVCQDSDALQTGMPVAIDTAYPWIKGKTVLMGMPDTIVEPYDSFSRVYEIHMDNRADLTLGIFPTDSPQRLAPVVINTNSGKVKAIFDKPKKTSVFNTWGIAVWSPQFTEMLHDYVSNEKFNEAKTQKELCISDAFNEAIKQGQNVYGHVFTEGKFYDLGDINEFIYTCQQIESRQTSGPIFKTSENILCD